MNNTINQNLLRQLFFIVIISLLGLLLFLELNIFLPAMLGAVTLYILMHRILFYFTDKKKWGIVWTTLLLVFLSMLVILFPIGLLINMLTAKISYAIQHSTELVEALRTLINDLETRYEIELFKEESINKLGQVLVNTIPKVLDATFNILLTIFFMYFILYFMLVNGRKMETTLYEYVPLRDENVALISKDVNNMVVSNALGIPLVAFVQGLTGLIGYLIIGVDEPLFWFVATCITSMIPIVGAAAAYIPLAIIFFANGQNWQAIAMLGYGFLIIGLVDNIFRFALQKKIGNIHPLVTVFGVIIGIKLFGFIGLIFGPLLISMFLLLLKIYSYEFMEKKRDATQIMEN